MKIGLYSDPHVTRKMGSLQIAWDLSVVNTFREMYYLFVSEGVDLVVCAGDFFDKSVLEANSVDLVNKVLEIMESSGKMTYILSGNHEFDSTGVSVLDYFKSHNNIRIVTAPEIILDSEYKNLMTLLPYSSKMEEYIEYLETVKSPYLVTHADILGSSLAGGKSVANYGYDPKYFEKFKIIFNGHIHTRSTVSNILNIGSVLNAQHGEIRYGEYPMYYTLDLSADLLTPYDNKNSIIFSTVSYDGYLQVQKDYRESNLVLRVDCTEEQYKELSEIDVPQILRQTLRLNVSDRSLMDRSDIVRSSVDIKEFMTKYISGDGSLDSAAKKRIQDLALTFLN